MQQVLFNFWGGGEAEMFTRKQKCLQPLSQMTLTNINIHIKHQPSLPNSMQHIPSSKANSQKKPHILWNPKFNLLTPNDDYSGCIAPLTSKRCILYIYSTNTGTEYFKHGIYSPLFPLQNAVCFINLTYLVPVLFTFYI